MKGRIVKVTGSDGSTWFMIQTRFDRIYEDDPISRELLKQGADLADKLCTKYRINKR